MILQTKAFDPFFTNDPAGFVRLIFAFVLGMSPVFGLVVWFLRRGPDQEIGQLKTDLTALGKKVDDQGKDMERDRERALALQREITENQRELVDMLSASGRAIQAEIRTVDVRMARIEERSDIAECFENFGTKLENAIIRAAGQR